MLDKLKPSNLKDSGKSNTQTAGPTTPAGLSGDPNVERAEGPPVVSGGGTNKGKKTRFSDMADVSSPPGEAGRLSEAEIPTGSADVGRAESPSTSTKLRKDRPSTTEGDPGGKSGGAAPLASPGEAARPGSRPAGTGKPARSDVAPQAPSGAGEGTRQEDFVLPDGRTAHVDPFPSKAAAGAKKGKPLPGEAATGPSAPSNARPSTESDTTPFHCPICCPNAPRNAAGVPIESCEHQDGAMESGKQKEGKRPTTADPASVGMADPANKLSKKKPTPAEPLGLPAAGGTGGGEPTAADSASMGMTDPANKLSRKKPPAAEPLGLPVSGGGQPIPQNVTFEEDVETGKGKNPAMSAKLKKTSTPAVNMTPEEMAMEDAKTLAGELLSCRINRAETLLVCSQAEGGC